jgi:choline-sulfatase
MEPHDPYQPPSDHRRRFARPYRGPAPIAAGDPNPLVRRLDRGPPGWRVPERELRHLRDLYDEEISYFDGKFGELLEGLDERGLSGETLIVLLSDHGEDFFERRALKHCNGTRDTQIHVPLVIHVPSRLREDAERREATGRVVAAAVGNIDVVPTILDQLGLAGALLQTTAGDAMEGSSLRALMDGREDPDRLAFSTWGAWRSIVQGRYKLSLHVPSGTARLYDLSHDPGEEHDRRDALPNVADRLEKVLRARLARVESDVPAGGDDTDERLRALGYLE